jgi:hypothetical protein
MENEQLPPKTVKAQLVRLDDNLKRIERAQFAGIQRAPGSLPVLEAFQLFLENERKIAQRRLWAVTGISLFSILITVAGAAVYIHHMLRNADARTDELARTATKIETNIEGLAQRQQTADAILQETSRTIASQQAALNEQSERISQQQQAASATQQSQASEVVQLREKLEALLTDQEAMRRMLAEATTPSPRQQLLASQPQQTAQWGPVVGQARPSQAEYAVITIPSEGRTDVRWMLPTVSVRE